LGFRNIERIFTTNHTNSTNHTNTANLSFLKIKFVWFVVKILLIPVLFCLFPFSCAQHDTSRFEFALGTVCVVTLFEQGRESVYSDIFSRLREIENLMSVNIPSSDVSRVNAAAGIEPVRVHADVFTVIKRAKYFAELSGGAFNPAVGPLVSLWGITGDNPRVPSQNEINDTLPLVNARFIELDSANKTVFLTQYGMALDLGAIAKGYAADEAAAIAKRAGVKRAKIDLGGNIVIFGEKPDRTPWRVGIQNPGSNRGEIFGILQITEKTIVTSGVYERYFEENGKRYHHLFDPSSGYPADNGLVSVTIITDNSMDADALSTAVFVLGYEAGSAFLEKYSGAEAVFVFEDSVRKTSGINFTLSDMSYRLY